MTDTTEIKNKIRGLVAAKLNDIELEYLRELMNEMEKAAFEAGEEYERENPPEPTRNEGYD
jgi:hypothetical protein